MQIELNRSDLKPEYELIDCSRTKFEHFNLKAQAAICTAGKATFYQQKGTRMESYNVIYAPTETLSEAETNAIKAMIKATRAVTGGLSSFMEAMTEEDMMEYSLSSEAVKDCILTLQKIVAIAEAYT